MKYLGRLLLAEVVTHLYLVLISTSPTFFATLYKSLGRSYSVLAARFWQTVWVSVLGGLRVDSAVDCRRQHLSRGKLATFIVALVPFAIRPRMGASAETNNCSGVFRSCYAALSWPAVPRYEYMAICLFLACPKCQRELPRTLAPC